jgi:hypothetical protein
MVEEWEHYLNALNIEYITRLDSLFTVPKARLGSVLSLRVRPAVPARESRAASIMREIPSQQPLIPAG